MVLAAVVVENLRAVVVVVVAVGVPRNPSPVPHVPRRKSLRWIPIWSPRKTIFRFKRPLIEKPSFRR